MGFDANKNWTAYIQIQLTSSYVYRVVAIAFLILFFLF